MSDGLRKRGLSLIVVVLLATATYASASDDQVPARPASIAGKTEEIFGAWRGGDSASSAIFGTMNIGKSRITWKGNNNDPRCTVSYQRIAEGFGVKFLDQTDNEYVTVPGESRYTTFLLRIKGGKCALGLTHFRLTLNHEQAGYLALVKYKGTTNALGRMHFFRN